MITFSVIFHSKDLNHDIGEVNVIDLNFNPNLNSHRPFLQICANPEVGINILK